MTAFAHPLLRHLICPACAGALSLRVFQTAGAAVEEGLLACGCGTRYPIVAGIPRMLPDAMQRHRTWAACHGVPAPGEAVRNSSIATQAPESVGSFGFQWARHPAPYSPERLHRLVLGQTGLTPADFAGHLVLDAGCGHGSQAAFMAGLGARVIGVDLSPEAAAVAREKIGRDERGLVVQADLARLPFPDGLFDLVYSEGVLHHTHDPRASFRHLVRKVRSGGYIAAGFYLKPSSWTGRLRLWANDRLRRILAPLPAPWVRALCWLAVPATRIPVLRTLATRSFVFWDPENPGWRETWQLNFDWYGTHHYQFYFTEDEVVALFTDPALGHSDLFRGKPNFFRATVGARPQARTEPSAAAGVAP